MKPTKKLFKILLLVGMLRPGLIFLLTLLGHIAAAPAWAQFTITVDAGTYQCPYSADGSTRRVGTRSFSLTAGTHTFASDADAFTFDVDGSGNVTSNQPTSASGSGGTLTLSTVEVTVVGPAGIFYNSCGVSANTGTRTFDLVTDLGQFFDVGRTRTTVVANTSGVTVDGVTGNPLTVTIESNTFTFTVVSGVQEVDIDIKPGSCPNPLNTKSKGVLPVAILGSVDFDVNDVDVSTVELEGVSPLRSSIEDVSTPVADPQDECDCTTDGADGFDDLTLKFDSRDIVAALGLVNDGDQIALTLTSNLLDGTAIEGQDCIIIKSSRGNVRKRSLPEDHALSQNHPNPFNPSTQIQFALPNASHVKLEIYNVMGELIAILIDETRPAGYYSERFDATGLASGIYFYRLQAGEFVDTKRLLLLR